MGYERPEHRCTPEKSHVLGRNMDSKRFVNGAIGLTLPMKVLLLPHNGSFYGAVSVYNSNAGKNQGVVYWNNLLRDRHVILPIHKADENSVELGDAYFMINNNGERVSENPKLSKTNSSKLEFLVEQVIKDLKKVEPELRSVTPPLKGILRKTFPKEYVKLVETYFKTVGYVNKTIYLPLDQNH